MELNEIIPEKKLPQQGNTSEKIPLEEEKKINYENNFHKMVGDEYYQGLKKFNNESQKFVDAFEDYYQKLSPEEREKEINNKGFGSKTPQEKASFLLSIGKNYYDNSRYGLIQKAGGFEKYMDKCEEMLLEQKNTIEDLKKQQENLQNKMKEQTNKEQTLTRKTEEIQRNYSSLQNPFNLSPEEKLTQREDFLEYVLHIKL